MFRLVVLSSALVALAAAQQGNFVDPKNAKILKEQRFNAGDGRAGSAFATEDGVVFREEADIDGNRIGQYSYVGDDGKTYTVKYSAGTDGFRILDGSHVPSTGRDAAAFNPDFVAQEPVPEQIVDVQPQPRPQSRPQPRPQPRPQSRPLPLPNSAIPEPQPQQFVPEQRASNENPFINPHDPTHRNFQFNQNAARFDPNSPLAQQQSLVPDCAGCKGVNPFINPHDPSHQSGGVLAGHLAGFGVPQQQQTAPRAQAPVRRPAPAPVAPREFTTEAPRRFFPPGELKLNRFETGFNFDFES